MFMFRRKKPKDKGSVWKEEYENFRQKQYEYIMKRRNAENSLSELQKKEIRDMKMISLVSGPLFFGASLWNLLYGALAGFVLTIVFFLIVFRRNFRYAAVPALMWAIANGFLGLSALFGLFF